MAHIQTPAALVGAGGASSYQRAFGSNVTAGNAIFVCSTTVSQSVTGVTDSLGNTYVQVGTGFTNGVITNQIWYALNITGGACTVTVTLGGNAECSFTVSEFSQVVTSSAVDVSGGAAGSSASASVSLNTTNADDVLIGCMSHVSAQQTLTSGSGFSILAESELVTNMPIHSEYRIVASTSNWTVDVTCGGSVSWKIFAAAFKLQTGGTALTGVSASGAVGIATPASALAVSGVAGTGSAGTAAADRALALSGAAATASVGNLTAPRSLAVSGAGATAAAGTAAPARSLPLSGLAGAGAAGSVAVAGSPDLNIPITGVLALGFVGTLTREAAAAPSFFAVKALQAESVERISAVVPVFSSGLLGADSKQTVSAHAPEVASATLET